MALTGSPNAPSIVLIIHVGQHVKGFRDTSQGREGGNSTRLNIVFCSIATQRPTYGLEHFWNSRHRRSEKGLEVSAVAWLDITDNCAYGLSVEQTPPSDKTSEPQGTRIDACLEQLRGVVCDHHLKHLRYVIADGYYSKRKFLDGVRALGLHQIGKLRRDANLRYLYQGVGHPGPGRPKTYDGKVQWDDLSRFERVQSEDDDIVLYHQVLNHVHLRRNLRVVLVVDTRTQRRAILLSTDTDLDAWTLYRGYKARFQIEFLFRDAKQFTSLNTCQARSQAKLHVHFNASMSALTLGKLEARQQSGNAQAGFSMASLKRRAFNQHLPERIFPQPTLWAPSFEYCPTAYFPQSSRTLPL